MAPCTALAWRPVSSLRLDWVFFWRPKDWRLANPDWAQNHVRFGLVNYSKLNMFTTILQYLGCQSGLGGLGVLVRPGKSFSSLAGVDLYNSRMGGLELDWTREIKHVERENFPAKDHL